MERKTTKKQTVTDAEVLKTLNDAIMSVPESMRFTETGHTSQFYIADAINALEEIIPQIRDNKKRIGVDRWFSLMSFLRVVQENLWRAYKASVLEKYLDTPKETNEDDCAKPV